MATGSAHPAHSALAALRSLLFILWMAITVVPWALAVLVMSLFVSSTTMYWACAGWLRVAIWGCRVICGVRARVTGLENVPTAADAKGAVLLAPKHQSTWETFAFPTLMPHPLAYVFKRELLYIPFFGWAMARMDMIHIDRSRRAEAWNRVAEQGRRLFAERANVRMGRLGDDEIARYVAGGEWDGKAGAYNLRERIDGGWPLEYDGDPTTIMGLPMRALLRHLQAML